jgi:hypothetical protein
MRLTRYCIGMISKTSLTVSPILCSRSPQQGQLQFSTSITTSTWGRCFGSLPRLRRADCLPRPSGPSRCAPQRIIVDRRGSHLCGGAEQRQLPRIDRLGARAKDRALVLRQDQQKLVVLLHRDVALGNGRIAFGDQRAAFRDNSASCDDNAITLCRSNAGSEGKSAIMQTHRTTTLHELRLTHCADQPARSGLPQHASPGVSSSNLKAAPRAEHGSAQ